MAGAGRWDHEIALPERVQQDIPPPPRAKNGLETLADGGCCRLIKITLACAPRGSVVLAPRSGSFNGRSALLRQVLSEPFDEDFVPGEDPNLSRMHGAISIFADPIVFYPGPRRVRGRWEFLGRNPRKSPLTRGALNGGGPAVPDAVLSLPEQNSERAK